MSAVDLQVVEVSTACLDNVPASTGIGTFLALRVHGGDQSGNSLGVFCHQCLKSTNRCLKTLGCCRKTGGHGVLECVAGIGSINDALGVVGNPLPDQVDGSL